MCTRSVWVVNTDQAPLLWVHLVLGRDVILENLGMVHHTEPRPSWLWPFRPRVAALLVRKVRVRLRSQEGLDGRVLSPFHPSTLPCQVGKSPSSPSLIIDGTCNADERDSSPGRNPGSILAYQVEEQADRSLLAQSARRTPSSIQIDLVASLRELSRSGSDQLENLDPPHPLSPSLSLSHGGKERKVDFDPE
ncbi:hypothetical protein IE53DRAFT_382915 [Violaceomyces palustris]|uniref:Uncharacterized protein n=1 Tax=Violaceomyces palustris TaxID=1673888 RepID=A0ACD0P8T1_9BASI|nr:hypothetical protein IE53DRAFT_382915 [Violaceomyces palustris]